MGETIWVLFENFSLSKLIHVPRRITKTYFEKVEENMKES